MNSLVDRARALRRRLDGSGVAGAALVGWLADGTPRSMGALVGAAGVAAFITGRLLKR